MRTEQKTRAEQSSKIGRSTKTEQKKFSPLKMPSISPKTILLKKS
jgi:hypothetical protein